MTVKVIRHIAQLRDELASFRRSRPDGRIGFVPTMGYLHAGHASLLKRSVEQNGLTVISIFVNPLQFGPSEDYERYPRDEARDVALAQQEGADIVFMPQVEEMYPAPMRTTVSVSELTERMCGASRPGHFDGVATVVAKLLNIVQPDRAYFGLKDAQQVAVVEQMVRDLHVPVEIVACPIVREADGLAMSSRNVYLSEEERKQARILSQTLAQVPEWIANGMTEAELTVRIRGRIRTQPLADIDYVEVVSYPDLTPLPGGISLRESKSPLLVALAVKFGRTRLIDNVLLYPAEVNK